MATDGWRQTAAVAETLYRAGNRFDFYQALRLLELLHPQASPPGEAGPPESEAVWLRSWVGQGFAGTAVAAIRQHDDERAELWASVLGLAGAWGPLPPPVTELLLERAAAGDTGLRDFLDMFNHRLLSLLYRVRKLNRPGFAPGAPDQTRFAQALYALIGLGGPTLRQRMALPDRALLRYAGLLARPVRPAVGLERMLADYFQVAVQVHQFHVRWVRLEPEDWSAIGARGRNRALGGGLLLGRRVRDPQGALEVCLGPLELHQFLHFMPGAPGYRALMDLARFYLDDALEIVLRVTLRPAARPRMRLGCRESAWLGRTSWVGIVSSTDQSC